MPELSTRLVDQTNTLSTAQRQAIESKLEKFERDAGAQIVVLIVAGTAPEDISSYAQRVGDTWKIGRRDIGDGLLLVVAKDDRRLWIAPAKALEGAIPDLAARKIAAETISPRFKAGDFAGGINAGLDQLMALIRGESLPAPQPGAKRAPSSGPGGPDFVELLMFAFIALPVVATVLRRMFGRGLGSLASAGAGGGLAWLVTHSLALAGIGSAIGLLVALFGGLGPMLRTRSGRHGGWAGHGGWSDGGGGWGGGGGGGFSSGGGGDFGGGGAGGDW